ncbi:MAG TPA: tetratricopeptide repeat protein [Kofleriaceae bacterium]
MRLAALLVIAACHRTPKPISLAPLPAGAYAHYLAGKLALYRDDPAAAADELRLAAAAAPDQPMIAVELARALAKAKRAAAARDVLVLARKKWPDHSQVWLASGEVLEDAAATRKEALDAYRKAIKLEPTEERAYIGLARTQATAGDGAGAERTLRALVKKLPTSVEGHYRLAQRLEQRGDRNAAIGELRAVLEEEPDHLDARLDLARTLRRIGKLEEAIAQTRSAFDRAGQPMDIAEELYWLLCEADDRQGAIDLLTLLDDDRSDADALATVAQFQRQLGRTPEARVVASHIKPLDPDAATIALAETDLAEGLIDSAVQTALSIPEKAKRYREARRVAVDALIKGGNARRALELLEPLRKAKPADLELAYTEALAHAEAGDAAKARELAGKLRGDAIIVAYLRARIADHLGDPAGALAILEPALRDNPEHVGANNLAGYLLADLTEQQAGPLKRARKQRLADAERYLARARDLQPGDPAILDSWGWLLYQQGRARDAVRTLDRASRFAPREPEILVHLASAWAADGAPRTAAEVLDRAEKLGPAPAVKRRIDALRASLAIR